jgi:hypothetical protein
MKLNLLLFFKAFILVLSIGLSTKAIASHNMGADLTYNHVSGNTFQFRLAYYRDCSGIPGPGSVFLNITSASCGISTNLSMPLLGGAPIEVSPLCAAQINQSTCNGGAFPGVQQYVYTATFTMPANCSDWVISYSDCCRNSAVTNVAANGIYIEALMNNLAAPTNSSPDFTTLPVPYICANVPFTYNHGAYDIEGDLLVYDLIDPRDGPSSPLAHFGGTTATQPFITSPANSAVFDGATGNMTFTPSGLQNAVLAVRVREYRGGVLISTVMRDMQVVILNCSNTAPTLGTPYNIAGGSYSAGNFYICAGQTLSFNIVGTDVNASDVLALTSSFPGTTISASGTNPATFTVTVPTSGSSTGQYGITLRVEDNSCPVKGAYTVAYNFNVQGIDYITPASAVACGTGAQNINIEGFIPGGLPGGATISWSPATYLSSTSTLATVANLPANATLPITYTLTYTNGSCSSNQSITITQNTVTATPSPTSIAACTGIPTSLSVNGSSSSGSGLSYAWSPATFLSATNASSVICTPTTPQTYTITVTAADGCTATTSIPVTISSDVPSSAPTSILASPPTICTSGGSSTLSVNGGVLGTNATWTWYTGPNGSGTLVGTGSSITVSPSTATTYYVRAEGGCNITGNVSYNLQVANVSGLIAPVPTSSNITFCNPSSVTLSATGSMGTNLVWFDDPSGINPLAIGNSYTTTVNTTSTYYVAENIGAQTGATYVSGIAATGSAVIDHNALSNDDRGGIAITSNYIYYSGDGSSVRYNLDLTGGISLGVIRDCIFSDLSGAGQVYSLANGSGILGTGGGTVDRIQALDDMLQPTGAPIMLSASMSLGGGSGIFSGSGFAVFHNTSGQVYLVELPSGTVTVLNAGLSIPAHQNTENWAYWGWAQQVGTDYFSVYVDFGSTISQQNLSTGAVSTFQSFSSLSDMATIVYAPWNNRWYFHYEGGAQFGGSAETLGYADATIVTLVGQAGCSGPLVPILVAINTPSVAATSISASPPTICTSGGSSTLSINGGSLGTGAVWNWYTGPNGTGTLVGTGSSITETPSSNTTYYVRAEGSCNNTSDASYVLQVANVTGLIAPVPNITNTSVCEGASVSLSATSSVGTTPVWFSDPLGTNILAIGNNYSASPSMSTTYYVAENIGAQIGATYVSGIAATGSAVIDHDALSGDDRGGIAITSNYIYYSGDNNTVRYNLDLTGGISLGVIRDCIFSDLSGAGQVYSLANSFGILPSGGGTVDRIQALDDMLQPTGAPIMLSASMSLSSGSGIFSGNGFAVFHNTTGQVYLVELPSGTVTILNAGLSLPSYFNTENWAYWGWAQQVGTDYFTVYVDFGSIINQQNLSTGAISTFQSFSSLSDMATIVYSPWNNRWYFHYEGSAQFGGSSETLGYADATIVTLVGQAGCSGPLVPIVVDVVSEASAAVASAPYVCGTNPVTLSLIGGGGSTIQWYSGSCNGTPVGTGNNLDVSISSNTTFYGRWESAGCNTAPCQTVNVGYRTQPVVTASNDGPFCAPGSTVNLTGTSSVAAANQTIVYEIAVTDLFNMFNDCGGGSRYNSCSSGNPVGFTWLDLGTSTPTSILVEYNVGVECNGPGLNYDYQVNGVTEGTVPSTNSWCSCGTPSTNLVSVNIPVTNYIAGSTNTFTVDASSCWGLFPDPALNNAYARVTVIYNIPVSYTWSPATFLNSTSVISPVATNVTNNTSYTLSVNANGCIGTATTQVAVSASGAVILAPSSQLNIATTCEETPWTYYESSSNPGFYVFAINWSPSGNNLNSALKPLARASVGLSTSGANWTPGVGVNPGHYQFTDGPDASFAMRRFWNVALVPTNQVLQEPVSIRFYYDANEYNAVLNAAAAWSAANGGGTVGTPFWFKSVSNAGAGLNSPFDPNASMNATSPIAAGNILDLTSSAIFGTENGINYVQFNGITSFSGGGLGVQVGAGTTLPLSLLSFTGKTENKQNFLNWVTAQEVNVSHFVVERSSNGIDFSPIGQVTAQGNSNEQSRYNFIDRYPFNGDNYYRLRMVDNDASFEYSHIINLSMNATELSFVKLYPNPANNLLNIELNTAADEDLSISIRNTIGQVVGQHNLGLNPGTSTHTLDISNLPNGVYMLEFMCCNGEKHQYKFVKSE